MLQAEIFRLHGQLLAAVEDNDAANKAFATSLALWPQLAEGWLSWGTFCDKQVSLPHSAPGHQPCTLQLMAYYAEIRLYLCVWQL